MKISLPCLSKENTTVSTEELKHIYVTEFDTAAVGKFLNTFLDLHADPSVKLIPVIISSYGGQVYSLLAMLDILSSSTKPVATVAIGKAMSCGAVLLSAGTKGLRFAAPNAHIMIHQVSSMEFGKTSDLTSDVEQTKLLNDSLMSMLSANCGKDKKYFQKILKQTENVDLYLTPARCKAIGLVDHVAMPNFVSE